MTPAGPDLSGSESSTFLKEADRVLLYQDAARYLVCVVYVACTSRGMWQIPMKQLDTDARIQLWAKPRRFLLVGTPNELMSTCLKFVVPYQ